MKKATLKCRHRNKMGTVVGYTVICEGVEYFIPRNEVRSLSMTFANCYKRGDVLVAKKGVVIPEVLISSPTKQPILLSKVNDNTIVQIDAAFGLQFSKQLLKKDVAQKIIATIDKARIVQFGSNPLLEGRWGYFRLDELSSGCKTALIVYQYLNTGTKGCISLCSAGSSVKRLIFNLILWAQEQGIQQKFTLGIRGSRFVPPMPRNVMFKLGDKVGSLIDILGVL